MRPLDWLHVYVHNCVGTGKGPCNFMNGGFASRSFFYTALTG